MSEREPDRERDGGLGDQIERKARRRLRAQRRKNQGIWFGLGLFGVVGWSIAIPTLLGVALGLWIDSRWPSPVSWTLTLMLGGLLLGCLNAWRWLSQARRDREEDN